MDKDRIKYDSKNNELFILEIKDDDELKNTEFIKIEDVKDINKYKAKKIYILPYKVEDKKKFPAGEIESFKEKEKIIKHNCNNLGRNQLESFFPILNLESYKIIGINKDKETGFFINEDIDAFIKEVEERMKLEISKINESEVKDTKTGEENENNKFITNTSIGESKMFNKPSSKNIEHEIDREMNENRNKLEEDKRNFNAPNNEEKIFTNNENIINYIIIMIKVNKEDIEINKNIYFFGNLEESKDKRENGFLTEMEKIKKMPNLELSISEPDNENKSYNKFFNSFKPKKEGNYTIELNIPYYISDCSYMFYNCPNLIDVDLSNFELSSVTKMNDMFNYCINLTQVKFSGKETKKLDNMAYMFNYCKSLKSIDFKNIDTEKVTDMSGMFQNCEKLEELDLTNFYTPNVSSLNCMFNDCFNLKSIKFSHKFITYKVLFMNYMFFGCEKLEVLDLSYFSLNTFNVKEMVSMFEGCDKIKDIIINRKYIPYFKQIHEKVENKFKKK
jgi:surface protein